MQKELTEQQINYKWDQKLLQKQAVLDRKYAKMIELRKDKLEEKKQREWIRSYNKFNRLRDIELHNLTAKRKRKIPEDKTVGKVKTKALAEIQKYAKLSRAFRTDKWIMIVVYDTMNQVPLDWNVNGGHVYSQKNYPQLAFEEQNIWPITKRWNKKQLDTTAEWKKNLPLNTQNYLEERSKDKSGKNELRDRAFYEEIIAKYKKLNENELLRLNIL